MKRSELIELIQEAMVGYTKNPQTGEIETTQGGTPSDFMKILTRLANDRPAEAEKYQGDPKRGNDILDRGNPNIPLDEADGITYSKDDLVWYLSRLDPNTRVTIPTIYDKVFSTSQGTQYTAGTAIQALEKTNLNGKFKLYMDNPTFKRFSLVQSAQDTKDHEELVRSMMKGRK